MSINSISEQNIKCWITSLKIWNFYYGITGIEKATRLQNGLQNLTIDYSTDTNGRILSAAYNETGEFNGNLTYVYDNYGNMLDLLKDDGNPAKAILINPNNSAIDTRYNPDDIDDPFTYRVRDGFMSIGPLWANNDDGTVYMQGHLLYPIPWGNVSTNGTTTTTTTDTNARGGGDSERDCDSDSCNSSTTSKTYAAEEKAVASIGYDCMCWKGKLSKKERENFKEDWGLNDSGVDKIENKLKKCCGETLPANPNKWLSIGLYEINGIEFLGFKCNYK